MMYGDVKFKTLTIVADRVSLPACVSNSDVGINLVPSVISGPAGCMNCKKGYLCKRSPTTLTASAAIAYLTKNAFQEVSSSMNPEPP